MHIGDRRTTQRGTVAHLSPVPPVGRGAEADGARPRSRARPQLPDPAFGRLGNPTRSPGPRTRPINLHDDTTGPSSTPRSSSPTASCSTAQLQDTVAQFEQTKGVVRKIDGTSRQLKEAIDSGARIIVTTIQKFSTEHLQGRSRGRATRTFAVIIDEAHSSQSGKSAQALADALTREATSERRHRGHHRGYQAGARAAAEHQLLCLHRHARATSRWSASASPGAGRQAAPVPPLLDAPGHRGGLHPGRAPELHDLQGLLRAGKGDRRRSRAADPTGRSGGRPLRLTCILPRSARRSR